MRKSCIWEKISRTLPLGCTVPCRTLNRNVSHTTKGYLLGPQPCYLVTAMGVVSFNLQSTTPWMEIGNGGPGGPRDGQGLVLLHFHWSVLEEQWKWSQEGRSWAAMGLWGHTWVYAASISAPWLPSRPGDQGCQGSSGIHIATNGELTVCLIWQWSCGLFLLISMEMDFCPFTYICENEY